MNSLKKAWKRLVRRDKEPGPAVKDGNETLTPSTRTRVDHDFPRLPKSQEPKTSHDRYPLAKGVDYKPLDESKAEIRVLNIIPGDDDSELKCTIQQFATIDGYPHYNALSYCWGDAEDLVSITVDDRAVAVTRNLEAVLRAFRKDGRYSIWVDALCINQDDKDERGRQILLMGAIYKNSVETIAWLGPDDGGFVGSAFERLRLFARQWPANELEEAVEQLEGGRPGWRRFPGWVAVKEFMGLPYWERTWIIQEIILSSKVSIWWGSQSLDLNTLSDAFHTLKFRKTVSGFEDGYRNIDHLLRIREMVTQKPDSHGKPRRPANFFEILRRTSRSQATEQRDKIFGVLGLSADGPLLIPSPDYRKPIDDIIRDLTISMLEQNIFVNDLRPMDHICIDNPRIPKRLDIPSWVTDWPSIWDSRGGEVWSSASQRGMESGYTASGTSQALVSFSEDRSTLHVQGFIFDTVNDLSAKVHPDALPEYEDIPFVEGTMSGLDSDLTFEDNPYGKPEDIYEAIWRCLVLDRRNRKPAPSTFRYHFAQLWSNDYQECVGQKYLYAPMVLPTVGAFLVHGLPLTTWAANYRSQEPSAFASKKLKTGEMIQFVGELSFVDLLRRMLTTEGGSVGLGPMQAEVGDKICLIRGCSMPVVLRAYEGGYRLIGEAYVHGIMDGGFWDAQNPDGMEQFDLK